MTRTSLPGAWGVSKAGAEGASGQAERQGLGGVATGTQGDYSNLATTGDLKTAPIDGHFIGNIWKNEVLNGFNGLIFGVL